MCEPVLVILAAGMGSRYGGLKQIDTVGSNGESIIDFSIYDAYKAGFKKVILIIRAEHEELFEQNLSHKIRPFMEVVYAHQSLNDLPEGFTAPEGRTKPWGTVQALLSTEPYVDGPFMIINADDFYGRESFEVMYNFLKNEVSDTEFGMVGYILSKTLSDSGAVTRALCKPVDGHLDQIIETQKTIRKDGKPYVVNEDGTITEVEDGICSMNYWGFTPAVYPYMKKDFKEFLEKYIDVPKSELVIPTTVGRMVKDTDMKVKIMSTTAEWFGVTYPEDKPMVVEKLRQYKEEGIYPFDLWKVEEN